MDERTITLCRVMITWQLHIILLVVFNKRIILEFKETNKQETQILDFFHHRLNISSLMQL